MDTKIENKYYTPEIDEFYIGFEYEVFQKGQKYEENVMYLVSPETEDKWYKFKYPNPFLGYNLDRIFKTYKGRIRVKYLDKEDIESLGFVYDETSTETQWKFYKDNICLFYRPNTKELGTFTINPSKSDFMSNYNRDNKTVSFLIIKNKSELKRLLKQLNINE